MLWPQKSKKDSVALGAKTLRSAFIFASFALDAETFGRARRKKNFGRPSFLHRSRQSQNIRSRQALKNFGRHSFLHRSPQSLKC